MSESKVVELPAVVMFYSPTCAHCHVMEPYFRKYAEEYERKLLFIRLNIMTSQFTTQRYGVMGTPTFKFFCLGRPIQELVGEIYPPLLKKTIEDVLKEGNQCVQEDRMTKKSWFNAKIGIALMIIIVIIIAIALLILVK